MKNATNSGGEQREEHLLAELLREAGAERAAPSAKHVEHMRRQIAHRTAAPTTTRRRVAIGAGLAVAASILLWLFGLDSFRQQDSWAQVVKNVRERPWLHSVLKHPDGKNDEFWLSFTGQVAARKAPEFVRFDNVRSGVREEYREKDKSLLRMPISDPQGLKGMVDTFQAIFRGDEKLADTFADFRVEKQKRREVERGGRKWIEYEMQLVTGGEGATFTIVVDPQKNLPVSMELKSKSETVTFELTFPDDGPADIYALGAPRDAKVDDRMPPAELATVLRANKLGREHSHNYFSAVSSGGMVQEFVWRKGNRWRVDLNMPQERGASVRPGADEKLEDWIKKYQHVPVQLCDGRAAYRFYRDSADKPGVWEFAIALRGSSAEVANSVAAGYGNARQAMAEVAAYPNLEPSTRFDLALDRKPAEGPQGTVLITSTARGELGPNAYHKSRYWLDPAYGYAVVRYEHTKLSGSASGVAPTGRDPDVYQLEDYIKSPQGQWYPTTIRHKGAIQETDKDGKPMGAPSDSVRTFYYDFKADLPDALFQKP